VNLVLDFEQDERLEVAVEERAPVVSFSFGLRPDLVAGDPASARAALAAGAVAVVMGTRFVASDECDAHPGYKARLLRAEARDTVLTELFDVGWPASPHRHV
jgi:NAD(P)H-dependent flavin oxidoreductase YrpB (nitropropane dioxygenase family)